jgi:hypothetical protein
MRAGCGGPTGAHLMLQVRTAIMNANEIGETPAIPAPCAKFFPVPLAGTSPVAITLRLAP